MTPQHAVPLKKTLAITLGVALALNVLVFLVSIGHVDPEHWHQCGLQDTLDFLRLRHLADSWGPMAQTYAYLAAPHTQTTYNSVFFDQKLKFIYPLTSLLIYVPTHGHLPIIVPIIVSWLLICAGIAASLGIYLRAKAESTESDPASNNPKETRTELLLMAALGLTFFPTMQAYAVGQIQVWINAFIAIAFWLWMRGRPGPAGVLIGLACLIKPQYAIILLWALLRKQGRLAATLGATLGVGLLTSVLVFGLRENLDYLTVVRYVAARGEAFYPNQTFNGLLNRAFHTAESAFWSMHTYPSPNPWVSGGTTLTSLLLIAAALFWPRRKDEHGKITDLMTVTLSATMASPIAWEHHYGILLPIYALLLPRLHRTPVWGRATLPLLALSYMLTGVYLSFINRLANTSFNLLQSYLLLGALLALALLYELQRRKPSPMLAEQELSSPAAGVMP